MPELIPGYSYEVMARAELTPYIEEIMPAVFAHAQHLPASYAYSETEQEAVWTLGDKLAERFVFSLGIFYGDIFVGWHIGNQFKTDTFEMTSTGILQEHRGRGLYTALIPVVLAHAKGAGFQVVSSRHNLTNNAVIVPKLKAGFIISGFEVSDRFGTLVQLSHYFNPLRRKMIDVRVGQSKIDDETRKFF